MRLYRRSKEVDLNDTIALAGFDADHGQLDTALERLRDLEAELGPDARICYAEGLLRKDFLGQGRKAFECFARAAELDPEYALAACNAAVFAPTEAEYQKRSLIAARLSPADAAAIEQARRQIRECGSFARFRLECGLHELEEKDYGGTAAYLELGLAGQVIDPEEATGFRRLRAQSLRALDERAANQRETAGEWFPPLERLALQEALLELDRAIALDEYDAEIWNLRSAWCTLLERFDDAVAAAERSIALRPSGYAKPFQNKATAFWRLGRTAEAKEMANRAREEARTAGSPKDIQLAESFLEELRVTPATPLQEFVVPLAEMILKGSLVRATKFAGLIQGTVEDLDKGFQIRTQSITARESLAYVPAVAQLLAYYPVDASATVMRKLCHGHPLWPLYVEALCYVAAHGEPTMQLDAARVAALLVLDQPSVDSMRGFCRQYFISPGAADPENFGVLAQLVGDALRRLNRHFPKFLMEQPAPGFLEIEDARSGMIERLRGIPFVNDLGKLSRGSPHGPGCGGMTATLLMAALLGGTWSYHHQRSANAQCQPGDALVSVALTRAANTVKHRLSYAEAIRPAGAGDHTPANPSPQSSRRIQ
jgi:tetratricopeptide (TPR) repeat protein